MIDLSFSTIMEANTAGWFTVKQVRSILSRNTGLKVVDISKPLYCGYTGKVAYGIVRRGRCGVVILCQFVESNSFGSMIHRDWVIRAAASSASVTDMIEKRFSATISHEALQ